MLLHYAFTHLHFHMHIHTYNIQTYIHTNKQTYMHMYIHTYTQCTNTYTHKYSLMIDALLSLSQSFTTKSYCPYCAT